MGSAIARILTDNGIGWGHGMEQCLSIGRDYECVAKKKKNNTSWCFILFGEVGYLV